MGQALAMLLLFANAQAGPPPPTALLMDPTGIDPNELHAAAERGLLDRVGTVAVSVIGAGHALSPPAGSPLAPYPGGPEDVCRELLQGAVGRHQRAVAFLDLLGWQTGARAGSDAFGQSPELAELGLREGLGLDPPAPRYASPCSAVVRDHLAGLVTAVTESHPDVSEFVFRCRLDPLTMLGYSTAQRSAYIHAAGMDPIDIPLRSSDSVARAYQAMRRERDKWVRLRLPP